MMRNLVTVILAILFVFGGYLIIKKHIGRTSTGQLTMSSDVIVFVTAGKDMLQGNDIYYNTAGEKNSYVYPPFYAFVNVPLSFLPPIIVDIAWFLFNAVLIGLTLKIGYQLFTAKLFRDLSYREKWIYAGISILFSLRYLVRNFQDANVNVLVLFLILLAVYFGQKSSNPAWAILIGIAAAIKILPLIFIVYFAGKHQWKQAAYLICGFATATFAPAFLIGIPKTLDYLHTFYVYIQSQLTPDGLVGENFSLFGLLGRLFTSNEAFQYPEGVSVKLNIISISLITVRHIVTGINIIILVWLYFFVRRDNNRRITAPLRDSDFAVACLVMHLVSVLTEDHHTVSFMLVFLYLLLGWKFIGSKMYRFTLVFTGVISSIISYDVMVPLFGKLVYLKMLAYTLPVLPVSFLLLMLVLYSYAVMRTEKVQIAPSG